MINLKFDTSKISVLLNTVMHYETIKICEKYGVKNKYSTAPAKSNKFFNLIGNEAELRNILTEEELKVCKEIMTKKIFNEYNFITVILEYGDEVLEDDNFENLFTESLNEWKDYYKAQLEKAPNERRKQYTNEELTSLLDSLDNMLGQQKIFISALHKLMKTDEFQDLYNTTLKYKEYLENNWNVNKQEISEFIEKVTGIQGEKFCRVMVLPPLFDNGLTTSGVDRDIYYSRCHDERENHELIELAYLTHESMHSQVLPYQKDQDIDSRKKLHGFIQYLCDNELYSRLAAKKGITYHYGENQQHGIDDKTFENMYPFFIGYLYRNEENPKRSIIDNMLKNKKYSIKKDEIAIYIVPMYSPEKIAKLFRDRKDLSPYDFSKIDFNLAEKLFGVDNGYISKKITKNPVKNLTENPTEADNSINRK